MTTRPANHRPGLAAPTSATDAVVKETTAHRVLVVDDNVDAAELLCELLQTAGHAVEVAHDAVQALGKATTFRPTAALLDIGLPTMDGYELAARLREQLPGNLTLIALTGYGQTRDREQSRAAGFDAHWVKPVDVATLRSQFPNCRSAPPA